MHRCVFCEEFKYDDDNAGVKHMESVHPIIWADILTMMRMGYEESEIDEITLSEQYTEGRYPGFRGNKDTRTSFNYRVMMRVQMSGLFQRE